MDIFDLVSPTPPVNVGKISPDSPVCGLDACENQYDNV